ncbi:hypothetical protein L596_002925 [Steinernema carpocapsae]|uniref:Uncharacterized protein n=1 Tax=Steinernema carpocapsae TaxID=34508 RepID=A0A4V6I7L7_STECR|nr:hypothetical protein L596_002925 [Steinernema carpocapsae]
MTRHIGADLLKRLVVAENLSVGAPVTTDRIKCFQNCGGFVLTTTGKDLATLSFFQRSIQKVANLFLHLDARTEESLKIYELLLSFCSVSAMRTPVCSSILSTPVSTGRAVTPFWIIAKTAKMTFTEAMTPDVPISACRLMRFLLKEVFDCGKKISEFLQISVVSEIVVSCVGGLQEFEGPLLTERCQLLTEGLRIAEVAALDDDIRPELLSVVSSGLCSKIFNDQIMMNPITHQLQTSTAPENIPEWSLNGTEIILELIKVLATLKDFSKLHKDLYWRTLKDERLIPFIAFAIANGSDDMVSNALLLYNHCKQVPEFQSSWLGSLISSWTKSNRIAYADYKRLNGSCSNLNESFGMKGMERMQFGSEEFSNISIEDFLGKVKQGMAVNGKDARLSQIVGVFEKKLSMMESREKELETLISIKDHALAQNDRQRFSNGSSGTELNSLKTAIAILENSLGEEKLRNKEIRALNDKLTEQIDAAKTQAEIAIERSDHLQKEKLQLTELLQTQQTENVEERKIQHILRLKFDDMTEKFTTTSKTLFEAEEQVAKLNVLLMQATEATEARSKVENAKLNQLEKSVTENEQKLTSLKEERNKIQLEKNKLECLLKGIRMLTCRREGKEQRARLPPLHQRLEDLKTGGGSKPSQLRIEQNQRRTKEKRSFETADDGDDEQHVRTGRSGRTKNSLRKRVGD